MDILAAYGVVVPDRPAGDGFGVGVEFGVESERVDALGHAFHAARKSGGVGLHASVGGAVAEEAVVDVDMVVAGITESGRNEGFGLPYDKRVGDVDPE